MATDTTLITVHTKNLTDLVRKSEQKTKVLSRYNETRIKLGNKYDRFWSKRMFVIFLDLEL